MNWPYLGCYFTYRLHTWYQGTTQQAAFNDPSADGQGQRSPTDFIISIITAFCDSFGRCPLVSFKVTDDVSYVASPNFNGLENLYPNVFKGTVFINVTFGHSVLTNFLVFIIETIPKEHTSCDKEFLEIEDTAENRKTEICGLQVNHIYTSTKSWRGYIFTSVCLSVRVCVCVCLSVCE